MKNKITILFSLVILSFGFAGVCNAAALITDDFNSYTNGNLTYQGKWIGGSATVQSGVVYEGAKAVKLNSFYDQASMRTIGASLQNDGMQTFYVMTTGDSMWIRMREFDTYPTEYHKAWVSINANVKDKIAYYDATTTSWIALANIPYNEWFAVQIQWRSSDHKVRYNFNRGAWSPWVTTSSTGPWINGLDVIYIQTGISVNDKSDLSYVDTLQEDIVKAKTPVLIVPGLMGSRLYENGNHLWEPLHDSDVQTLYLNEEGESVREDIYTKDIIDEVPISGGNIYKSILSDLEKRKNSGDIPDYGVVPYDWRLSIPDILASGKEEGEGAIYYTRATSTPYIEKALRNLAAISPTGKVTIIAHSNGGLLVKALINQLGSEASNLVDQLVLVAVPQLGTPKAIGGLLHGYKVGIPEQLPVVVTPSRARDFARNAPMIYQLLPHTDYYQSAGATISTPLVSFNSGAATQIFIDEYGQSITNSDELHHFLVGQEGRIVPAYSDLKNPAIANETILSDAEGLMQSIGSSWQAPAGIVVHQIAGIGENTLAGITYKTVRECVLRLPGVISTIPICLKYEPHLSYTPKEVIDGDGTVVVPSALAMSETDNVKRWWVDLRQYNNSILKNIPGFGFLRTDHKDILEINELRTFIFDNLIAKSSISPPRFISDTKPAIATGKRLKFTLHSPLTLSAIDDEGNEIRETVSTIPGARFERYGEVQVLTVPAEALPTLNLIGIEEGSFTLEIEELQEQTVIASTTFSGIISAPSTVATMEFPDGALENAGDLEIDYDNNGTVDISLSPNIGEEVTPDEPSLGVLLAILKREIKELNINSGIKMMLIKKIESLEKKIDKQKEQNIKALTKKLSNLTADIIKKAKQGIIDDNDMAIMLELLNNIEKQI